MADWRAALAALLLLAYCVGAAGAGRPRDDAAIEELLRSAQLWQALERPDAERTVLRKLLAVRADEPRALFLLGELELRAGNPERARRALTQLARAPGGGELTRELGELVRVYTREGQRLARLRLFVRGGNQARALVLARALFPDGRPPGDLANEFAAVLASTPGGWQTMRALLQERIAADPTPRDRLTLYELLAQHADTRAEALQGFADLARRHDVDPSRVASAWRHALLALAQDEEGLAQRRLFLERFPADAEMRAQVAQGQAAQLAAQQLANDPGVQLRLQAEHSLQAGALADAESQLQRSLQLRPDDAETIGLLGLVRLRQGRSQEALQQFEQASERERDQPGLRARWLDLATTARYWSALARARELRDSGGDLDAAVALVQSVQDTQPGQDEAIYVLASLRVAQKRAAEAERLYRQLLSRDRVDRRAWRGLLTLWVQQGRLEAALDQAHDLLRLANIAPEEVLDAGDLRDAIALLAEQHPDAALRLLERSVGLLPREPWLRYDLARLYGRLGLAALGQQVMQDGERAAPQDAPMRYAAALIDAASEREDAALAAVESIPLQQQSAGMRALAQRLRFERALRLARAARAAGDREQDAFWRAQALAQAGQDAARLLRVARADLSADDSATARPIVQSLADPHRALSPAERLDLIGVLIDAGQGAAALRQIEQMAAAQPADPQIPVQLALLRARAHRADRDQQALRADWAALRGLLPPEDIERHLEAVRLMDADQATAREWMAELLKAHPQDPQVLLEAARQAERDRHYESAIGYLQQVARAPQPEQGAGSSAAQIPVLGPQALVVAPAAALAGANAPESTQERAQRELAAIEARRQPQIDTSWLQYWRSATDGESTLRGTEIPIVAVWPGGYQGHWFAQVDSVRAYAGMLPAPVADSGQFGKVQALSPSGLAQGVYEQARGLSAAAGWRGEDRRFDLGIVGAGFKVPNIVGAWRESGTWHDADVSVELSRRVLNATLLSYAGAADPVTGAVWGGVTNNALLLRAGEDLGHGWSASSTLALGVVTGRNVEANPNAELRTVVDRDWIHRSDFRVSAGAVLSLWHYQSNQDFFTFGQGGYYSPQRYVSLGVPIEVEGRRGNVSYDVRAVPSWSWTYQQNAPYYPTDSGLQALAGNPIYTVGTGSGPAGGLRASVEWRPAAHWSVGAWLNIDRTAYYAPNQLMVYLRYWLEPQRGPVEFAPHPVVPISLF